MINQKFYAYKPDYAVHPGEYLAEILEAREIKKRELSERIGISVKHLSQIINKQALLTPGLALQLETALGISANIWNHLNADYSLFYARLQEENKLKQKQAWVKNFPIADLKKLKLLPDTKDMKILLRKLLQFFGVSAPEQWQAFYNSKSIHYRKSPAFDNDLHHLASWLRVGEISASTMAVEPYQKDVFKQNLSKIKTLTLKPPAEFKSELKQLCAMSGVILVFIPGFKKMHISGATQWLTPDKALITMSLRYKTNDHFWFTFFHEAAHILLHSKKEIFIDDIDGFESNEENEANDFAKNILIPAAEYRRFIAEKSFHRDHIIAFANQIEIHPGIVVGRLQHDRYINYKWHNKLKEKFELASVK